MNISEKQLKANQENCKLGGVKTDKGKAVVRYNAVKHGLLSRELYLDKNDREDFDEFKNGIIDEFTPNSSFEYFLVDRIIACAWRLRMIIKIEKNVILFEKNHEDEFIFGDTKQVQRKQMVNFVDSNYLEKMSRYETSIENKFYRAINEYRKLKNGFVS